MLSDWNLLSEELQLYIAQEALKRAALTIAGHAEVLAGEIEAGGLADRGGPDALRLLASVLLVSGQELGCPTGRA